MYAPPGVYVMIKIMVNFADPLKRENEVGRPTIALLRFDMLNDSRKWSR